MEVEDSANGSPATSRAQARSTKAVEMLKATSSAGTSKFRNDGRISPASLPLEGKGVGKLEFHVICFTCPFFVED